MTLPGAVCDQCAEAALEPDGTTLRCPVCKATVARGGGSTT